MPPKDNSSETWRDRIARYLDFDGDGQLGLGDFRAGAVRVLDQDGDGQLTVADAQIAHRKMGLWIDTAEEYAAAAAALWRRHGDAARLAGGVFVLLYGPCLQRSIALMQCLKVSGWPVIERAAGELQEHYWAARRRIDAELPADQQKGAVAAAHGWAEDAVAGRRPQTAEEKMQAAQRFSQVVTSLHVLARAVEPQKVFDILKGAYLCLAASFSTLSHPGAARLSIGASVGQAVAQNLKGFALPLFRAEVRRRDPDGKWPENVVQWAEAALKGLCVAVACMVAYRVETFLRKLDQAMLAGRLLADNLVAIAARHKVPVLGEVKLGSQVHNILTWILTGVGVYSQVLRGMPLILRLLLWLPLRLEAMLTAADVVTAAAPGK
eukprot:TRINITY_DN15011_c0_g1_i1.p2 TRINITY_DN15011_c0_g1~~TRINITY_DN15011_c0_g1_i1.p2  ORF type:complete len:380 (+),score=100.79 TRINITY_DN15011_c0_g1_i1:130-1269(+)